MFQSVVSIIDAARSATSQITDDSLQNRSVSAADDTATTRNHHAINRVQTPQMHSLGFGNSRNYPINSQSRRNYPTPSSMSAGSSATPTRSRDSPLATIPSVFHSTTTAPKQYEDAKTDAPCYGNDQQIAQPTKSEAWRLSAGAEPIFDFTSDVLLTDSGLNREPSSNVDMETSIFNWAVE